MRRGHFGIGVLNAKTESNIGTLWRSAHAFGADYIFTVGKRYKRQLSDTSKAWRMVPLFHYADLKDLIDHLPYDAMLIGVELHPKARPLTSYAHPERACYLLGAEDSGLTNESISRCQQLIQIPGAARCLNVAVAGSIVICDRISKAESKP